MLTREQEALAITVINLIQEDKSIPQELMSKLIIATTGNDVEKSDFRDFIAGYVAPLLNDKQLFEFTKSVMIEDSGYLLRDTSKLSGDLYKLFARRINYSPIDESQPDSMIVLNKLVYESIKKDKTIPEDKLDKGVATGIIFKFAPIPKAMTTEATAELKEYQKMAQQKQKHLIDSIKKEGIPVPEFKEKVKNVHDLTKILDLDTRLKWKLKELANAMIKYPEESASYKAAEKVLREAHILVKDMDAKDAKQVESLLSAISMAVIVLKDPKGKDVVTRLETEATKNTITVGERFSKAMAALAKIFKWNNKTEAKASNEGVFKYTTLAKPLAELAAAPSRDAKPVKP